MFTDFVLNSQGHGPVGEILNGVRYDPGLLRPYIRKDGVRCCTVNTGKMIYNTAKARYEPRYAEIPINELMARGVYSPVFNSTSLRKEQWIELDQRVKLAARQRLKAWMDLAASSTVGGFDAMARSTYEYEAQSDPGSAVVDMDGLTEGRNDSPLFKLRSIPLPITHSDFYYSQRRLAISANGGLPLNLSSAEAAGRRVAEMVEKTVIGIETGTSYGYQSTGVTAHDSTYGSQIYGYTNFPSRLTKTNFTAPSGGGWTPETTYNEVLAALDQIYAQYFYGPFIIYHSIDWTQYINRQFSVSGGNAPGETLRTMLMKIDGVNDVRRLDFLTDTFTLLIVQMTSDVCQAINGMDITTVQWEEKGGMKQCFKVMAIQLPLLYADYNDRCGILHGTTA